LVGSNIVFGGKTKFNLIFGGKTRFKIVFGGKTKFNLAFGRKIGPNVDCATKLKPKPPKLPSSIRIKNQKPLPCPLFGPFCVIITETNSYCWCRAQIQKKKREKQKNCERVDFINHHWKCRRHAEKKKREKIHKKVEFLAWNLSLLFLLGTKCMKASHFRFI